MDMENSEQKINLWVDEEGNRLTVTWGSNNGYYTDTDDNRVLVRVDMEGKFQGFQVDDLNSIRNTLVEAKRSLDWWDRLGKDNRGSRPRCVLLTDGSRDEVAQRLTGLVGLPDVMVCPDDRWMPCGKPILLEGGFWDKTPAEEAQLGNPKKANYLLPSEKSQNLTDWWLAVHKGSMTMPNWDIASTCTIRRKPGLLLVEAKAHAKELAPKSDRCGSTNWENRERIGEAIGEAIAGLHMASEGPWSLSRDHRYQLSNRFAWSWKLASLGVPVVLIYLGFLEAQDMAGKELFQSAEHWEQKVKDYSDGVVDNNCWGQWLDIGGTSLLPLIRTCNQKFYP